MKKLTPGRDRLPKLSQTKKRDQGNNVILHKYSLLKSAINNFITRYKNVYARQ